MAGARALDHGDPTKAEKDFAHAIRLDPARGEYAIAVGIAREHRVNQLVRQAAAAQRNGDQATSSRLLQEARSIDPVNQMVQEHLQGTGAVSDSRNGQTSSMADGSFLSQISPPIQRQAAQSANPQTAPAAPQNISITPAPDTTPAPDQAETPLGAPPALAGPIELAFTPVKQSFHFRSDAQDLLRRVVNSYGIAPTFDSSITPQSVRLDIDNATWPQALRAAELVTNAFVVPLTEKSVLVIKDTRQNRDNFEHMFAETVFLPALTAEQMSDIGNLVRTLFAVKQATVQTSGESLSIRAPEQTLRAVNFMLYDLLDGSSELLLEMHLYEVDRTRNNTYGPILPQQTTIFNLESEASSIINANQSLINQLIASGVITAGNVLEEIAALIAAGACGASVLCQPFATFGKGLGATGVGFSGISLSLSLNSSSVRAVDQVQMRVSDHQTATFRNGTRYPIVTSTASYGNIGTTGSTSSLLASLGLSQQQLSALGLGGANLAALQPAPYPLVQYEDLGLTLKATPVIQKSGNVSLHLDLQLQALTGASLDGNPVLSSRQYTSDITVREGTSAVLMSSMSRTESTALSGLPGLSELPGFFNSVTTNTNAEMDTQELVMVITPHVVRRRRDEAASPMVMLPMHELPVL